MVLAKQVRISDVLREAGQLKVPLYQRTYEWRHPEWSALFDDVARLALDRQEAKTETHFLGPLVLAAAGGKGTTRVTFVVDGQQRLLTLSLLMCAVRDQSHGLPAILDRQLDACLHATLRAGQKASSALRLLPTEADNRAYLMIVDREAPVADHQLTRAYAYFVRRLETMGDDSSPYQGLTGAHVARAIIAGLECVRISTQANDNVNRIYETLNNRGRPLTQGDLLRNYVFMRVGSDGAAFYEKTWAGLDTRFKGDELTHLFWLDLVRDKPSVTQRQTYVEQYKRLEKLEGPKELQAAIKAIAARGDLWELIANPSREKHAGVCTHLTRLHKWGTTTVQPVLMYLLEVRRGGQASDAELVKSLRYLESYFVRRMVIGRATDNMNRVLLNAPENIEKALRRKAATLTVDAALREYLSGEGKHWASNDELRLAVLQRPFYRFGKAHQKALLLGWIEEALAGDEVQPKPGLTVEHVMPQNLTAAWTQEIKAGLKPGERAIVVHESLVHTLGNLTLATPAANSGMSNNSFAAKKQHLKARGTGLQLTAEITKKHHWRPADIQARSDLMGARIIKSWPGPL